MSIKVLNEPELKLRMAQIYKEEKIRTLKEKWERFTKEEKIFVMEFYKSLHPESKVLSEAKWYNWLGDLIGFIPGLEIVNVINGISYWKQGDKLFALLSFLAGIPALGVIMGPVKVLFRGGGAALRALKGAVALGDAGKIASVASKSSVLSKFVGAVGKWGGKLLSLLVRVGEKVPFLKTIIKGIKGVVDLFKGAKTKMVGAATKLTTPTPISSLTPSAVGPTSPLGKMGSAGGPSGVKADPITNILSSMFGK